MKHFILMFAVISSLFVVIGCDKDKDTDKSGIGEVELVFRALWGGQPLVMNQSVSYPTGLTLRFAEMDFLLSNARLVASNGNELLLKDVALVNFTATNTDVGAAQAGFSINMDSVLTGNYQKLILGIGLDTTLNATKPQQYLSNHPLGVAGNRYWEAWSSYIFSKLQGLADTQGNGQFNLPFAYHAGGNGLYREVEFDIVLKVEENIPTKVIFNLAVDELFKVDANNYWDIVAQSTAHNPNNPAMLVIMDNYLTALTLQ